MKRTDKLTNLIAILLFLAFAAYVGAYAYRSLNSSTVTAEAVAAELSAGGVASGIVIREETVLTSMEKYIDVTAGNGKKVAAGTQIATAMSSELGLERASRMHELELEISRVSDALQEMNSADDLTARDETLSASIAKLTSAVARHELSTLDSDTLSIRSLLFGSGDSTVSEAELARLEAELQSLRSSSSGDTLALTAGTGGVFSSVVDGYEHLSYADVQDLTPETLSALIDNGREQVEGAYGKLVTSYRWYFAAVMSAADAANLSVGRTAQLNFGRYYGADVYAKVLYISSAEDGAVAVVFRCDTALAETLSMRSVSANVVFETYSGIRVPAQAVQTDPETETTFVWTITAMQLERKDVTIIYCDEDVVIVERSAATGTEPLREGNTVVVSGTDLYEGKIME